MSRATTYAGGRLAQPLIDNADKGLGRQLVGHVQQRDAGAEEKAVDRVAAHCTRHRLRQRRQANIRKEEQTHDAAEQFRRRAPL